MIDKKVREFASFLMARFLMGIGASISKVGKGQ
jgi:hypothetical protein